MARTIPEPCTDDFAIARSAQRTTAQSVGLDIEDPKVVAFIERNVAVHAQQQAEIRWLRNMTQPEFQGTRKGELTVMCAGNGVGKSTLEKK